MIGVVSLECFSGTVGEEGVETTYCRCLIK